MTLVLLDTNAYLRLAKRVRPLLGKKFGDKEYVLAILSDVENEVYRNGELRFKFPWFDEPDLTAERMATRVRLTAAEHKVLNNATSILRGYVLMNISRYVTDGRSPPSQVDCRVLAFGQIRAAIVVTDDLGMHQLADEFNIPIWHGYELLAKLRSHRMVSNELIREIFGALEANGDLTETWTQAKHTVFKKLFGNAPGEPMQR